MGSGSKGGKDGYNVGQDRQWVGIRCWSGGGLKQNKKVTRIEGCQTGAIRDDL